MVEFTVVVTSYFEEKSIEEFLDRLLSTMRRTERTFEVVLVNDGSTDKTFEKHVELLKANPEISRAINFFRNAGQLAAMSCGVEYGKGKHFIFIDSDLQLDPEEMPILLEKFDEGYDIVSGRRKNRKDTFRRKLPSKVANMIMAKVAGHQLTDFGCTYKVYNGDLIRPFNFGQYKPWKTAFVFSKAGSVIEVDITHRSRKYGESGWTLSKLLNFLFDHMVGISRRPFLWVSLASVIFAFLIVIRLILTPLFDFSVIGEVGNGLLLNVLFLIILLILAAVSALGEFVFRVFKRTEGDPIFVIKDHVEQSSTKS